MLTSRTWEILPPKSCVLGIFDCWGKIWLIMEDICRNCVYFALMCSATDSCLWGICKKTPADTEQMNNKKEVVFKWAEDTCSGFVARQRTALGHVQKWLEPLKKILKI